MIPERAVVFPLSERKKHSSCPSDATPGANRTARVDQALHGDGSSWFRRGWLRLSEARWLLSLRFGWVKAENIPKHIETGGDGRQFGRVVFVRFFGNFQLISHDIARNTHRPKMRKSSRCVAQSCSGSEHIRRYWWSGYDSSSGWVTCEFYLVRYEIWIQPPQSQVSEARQAILHLRTQGPSCWLYKFPKWRNAVSHPIFFTSCSTCIQDIQVLLLKFSFTLLSHTRPHCQVLWLKDKREIGNIGLGGGYFGTTGAWIKEGSKHDCLDGKHTIFSGWVAYITSCDLV